MWSGLDHAGGPSRSEKALNGRDGDRPVNIISGTDCRAGSISPNAPYELPPASGLADCSGE